MAGLSRFLVLTHLLLSVTFMGVAFALWYDRVDLTNTPAKDGEPAGLYAQERELREDLEKNVLHPALRRYDRYSSDAGEQEAFLIDDLTFYEDELKHAQGLPADSQANIDKNAASEMRAYKYDRTTGAADDLQLTRLTDTSARDLLVPDNQTKLKEKYADVPLRNISHYQDLLLKTDTAYKTEAGKLKGHVTDEVMATVELIGTQATLSDLQARIDRMELLMNPDDKDVVDHLKKLKEDVAKEDKKGVRLRIRDEEEKIHRLKEQLPDPPPPPAPGEKPRKEIKPEIIRLREAFENQVKIFDLAGDKLIKRIEELDAKKAHEALQNRIDVEEAEIRKLQLEIAQLQAKLAQARKSDR